MLRHILIYTDTDLYGVNAVPVLQIKMQTRMPNTYGDRVSLSISW